ncbi:YdcF family protein [Schlegelella sp. S2-27]|uniref:YdcF family protein n=1 Tax=Caldimonas mangrovi TaxID=2944811 RepID=A0ABT0YPL7_9BURK|nr:YdcF family protein [Caldimonas mangrovi]
MFINALIELLLPMTFYFVVGLLALTALSFRPRCGPALRRWRPGLLGLTLWAWVCSTPAVGNLLIRHLEGPIAVAPLAVARDPQALVIVLGSGQMWTPDRTHSVQLDQDGWQRLHEGVELWRRTGGSMLFTGGPPGDDDRSIAAEMGRVAQRLGVPADAILYSPRSRTTYEDLMQVQAEIHRHRGAVWLVTSAVHMRRATAVAARLGLAVQPYPVAYRQIVNPTWRAWLPHNGGPDRFATALHEIVGLWTYRLRGQAE